MHAFSVCRAHKRWDRLRGESSQVLKEWKWSLTLPRPGIVPTPAAFTALRCSILSHYPSQIMSVLTVRPVYLMNLFRVTKSQYALISTKGVPTKRCMDRAFQATARRLFLCVVCLRIEMIMSHCLCMCESVCVHFCCECISTSSVWWSKPLGCFPCAPMGAFADS